jgi:peptidoglycan biosynthesis protein MviN/MurJ (putative lipid II flippase)
VGLVVLAIVTLFVGLGASQPLGIGLAVALLAAAPLVGHPSSPPAGPTAVYAAGLLLVAELGFWSLERRRRVHAERGVDARRWIALVGVVAASVALALVVLLVGSEPRARGSAVEAAGVLAALGVAGLAVFLLRHRLPTSSTRTDPELVAPEERP